MPCSKQLVVQQVAPAPNGQLVAPAPNGQLVAQAPNGQPAQLCMAQTVPNEDIDDDFMYTETLSLHTNQQKQLTAVKAAKVYVYRLMLSSYV